VSDVPGKRYWQTLPAVRLLLIKACCNVRFRRARTTRAGLAMAQNQTDPLRVSAPNRRVSVGETLVRRPCAGVGG
jgi:hypothetical protein